MPEFLQTIAADRKKSSMKSVAKNQQSVYKE